MALGSAVLLTALGCTGQEPDEPALGDETPAATPTLSTEVDPDEGGTIEVTHEWEIDAPAGAAGQQTATLSVEPTEIDVDVPGMTWLAAADVTLSSGDPDVPLAFTWTFDSPVPDGMDVSFYSGDPGAEPLTMIPTELSADRMNATAEVGELSPKSVGLFDVTSWVSQTAGGIFGVRGDRPSCDHSGGELPDWVDGTTFVDQHQGDNPMLACTGQDPNNSDLLVVKVTNNRPYGLVMTSPVEWEWAYLSDAGGVTAGLVSAMSRAMPPDLSGHSVFVSPGGQAHFGFSHEAMADAGPHVVLQGRVDMAAMTYGLIISAIKEVLGDEDEVTPTIAAALLSTCLSDHYPGSEITADSVAAAITGVLICTIQEISSVSDLLAEAGLPKDVLAPEQVRRIIGKWNGILIAGVNAIDLAGLTLMPTNAYDVNVFLLPTEPSDASQEVARRSGEPVFQVSGGTESRYSSEYAAQVTGAAGEGLFIRVDFNASGQGDLRRPETSCLRIDGADGRSYVARPSAMQLSTEQPTNYVGRLTFPALVSGDYFFNYSCADDYSLAALGTGTVPSLGISRYSEDYYAVILSANADVLRFASHGRHDLRDPDSSCLTNGSQEASPRVTLERRREHEDSLTYVGSMSFDSVPRGSAFLYSCMHDYETVDYD